MHNVDEKDLMKLRAILARAEGSSFENEREVAWEAATRLMSKLSITVDDLDSLDDSKSKSNVVKYNCTIYRPYAKEKLMLLDLIGRVFSCVTVEIAARHPEGVGAYMYGFQQDIDFSWTLYDSLCLQMIDDLVKEGKQSVRYKKSFIREFAMRVSTRIYEFYFQSIQDDHGKRGEIVLANRANTVKDYVNSDIETVEQNKKVTIDLNGAAAGKTAGDRANISMGYRNVGPESNPSLT